MYIVQVFLIFVDDLKINWFSTSEELNVLLKILLDTIIIVNPVSHVESVYCYTPNALQHHLYLFNFFCEL